MTPVRSRPAWGATLMTKLSSSHQTAPVSTVPCRRCVSAGPARALAHANGCVGTSIKSWIGNIMVRVGNQGRSRAAARGFGAISIALFLVGLLTSCNLATVGGSTAPSDIDVLDKVRSADIMPRQPETVGGGQTNVGQRAKAAVYEGTEVTDVGDSRLVT